MRCRLKINEALSARTSQGQTSCGRVASGVAPRGSHRSGLALLRHPVRQPAALLGGSNYLHGGPPTTPDASRRGYGDRQRSRDVLPLVPHAGPADRHPPSPTQGPPGRVPLLLRYYEGVRLPVPLAPDSVAFARRYQAARLSFRSRRPRSHGRGPGVRQPVPPAGMKRLEVTRASQVPGEPRMLLCPVLRLRRDGTPLTRTVRPHGPR